jgi:hypothetical protein
VRWDYGPHDVCDLLVSLDLCEHWLKVNGFNLPISFVFNLEAIRTLDKSLKNRLTFYSTFLIFELLDAPHLIFEEAYLVLESLLLLFEGVGNLLLKGGLPLYDLGPDFVEDFADLAAVLIS